VITSGLPLKRQKSRIRRAYARVPVVVVAAALLSGCGIAADSGMFSDLISPRPLPRESSKITDQAFGKLAQGHFREAASLFDDALRLNPRDVHALLGRALVYQHFGQTTQARAAYESLLTLRPDEHNRAIVLADMTPQPVMEIARTNLDLLDGADIAKDLHRGAGMPERTQSADGSAAPMVSRTSYQSPQMAALQGTRMADAPSRGNLSPAERNIAKRFQIMARLRDEGLVTPAEFAARRRVNLGALLPYSQPPGPLGLDRDVPSGDQISARLQAIGRALEMRAITVEQHTAERSMIVDGLLPAHPRTVANPPLPPKGLMQAAARIGELEYLKEARIITPKEYTKERNAIEVAIRSTQPTQVASANPASSAPAAPAPQQQAKAPAAPPPASHLGVHLASFRTEAAARKAWPKLRRAYGNILASLRPEVSRVDLGPGKGIFYRLKAGPLPNQAAVERLCHTLISRRQYCQSTVFNGG
jgi:tetratricopeptide (TPR) repeat protein